MPSDNESGLFISVLEQVALAATALDVALLPLSDAGSSKDVSQNMVDPLSAQQSFTAQWCRSKLSAFLLCTQIWSDVHVQL